MSIYKYYFRQPKSEIVKDILRYLAMAGLIYVAASSPYFVLQLQRGIKKWRKYNKKRFYNVFYRLRRNGYIEVEKRGKQIYIKLTEEGKKKAGRFQIDALEIKRPKKWDGRWRIVIFDISQIKKFYREAFRGKLKELAFYPLQKSVWIHPFDCRDEIEVLREFFNLNDRELRLIVAEDIGQADFLKKIFKLN